LTVILQGGERIQESVHIVESLIEKYGSSVLLLNTLALGFLQLKKYNEAEKQLLIAMEKNSSDASTIINLITCYSLQGKPSDVVKKQTKYYLFLFR
jgi:coatomer protein complex subunit epsilon